MGQRPQSTLRRSLYLSVAPRKPPRPHAPNAALTSSDSALPTALIMALRMSARLSLVTSEGSAFSAASRAEAVGSAASALETFEAFAEGAFAEGFFEAVTFVAGAATLVAVGTLLERGIAVRCVSVYDRGVCVYDRGALRKARAREQNQKRGSGFMAFLSQSFLNFFLNSLHTSISTHHPPPPPPARLPAPACALTCAVSRRRSPRPHRTLAGWPTATRRSSTPPARR